ncbi:ABC transporter permease [Actinoplanes derwentensis]|uniref:ABC-2 family transporter protein n=1 Tax=Actinoplanes derwentensis TaxID=113562 RepID=A0A1H2AUT0_9ACTN|nr:ABC transporter permease [Actinoplanes derwentensis]GID84299.1 hypothetical protein Ade03nite_32230 [Actinoplanes derwentensis]SDT49673.1 ABC-2 family transporter protein [Actinoplanes derwentensis]
MVNLIRAELLKLLGLPTAWVGLALGTLVAPLLTLLNAGPVQAAIEDGSYGSTADLAYNSIQIGMLGAVILGVVVVSSEYTPTGEDSPDGRQLITTLLAAPRRPRLIAAKGIALTLVVAVQGTITAVVTLLLVEAEHGGFHPVAEPLRVAAAVLDWMLLGLLSYALTLIFRNGIVTLTLLIVNASVVSVSWLLMKVTPLGAYLPDIVGKHMYLSEFGDVRIHPVTAGLVMLAWVAGLLALAVRVSQRRQA